MKKILIGALALAMSCSMCTGVMAEAYGTGLTRGVMPIAETTSAPEAEAEENRLMSVLTAVKTVIDIPEEYTEFDYDLYTRYEEESWTLMWRTEDYSKNITVNCDAEGRITSYNNGVSGNIAKAPLMRKAKAKEIGLAFIEKVYPGVTASLKEEVNTYSYFGSGSYEFYFTREENGIAYSNNYASVSVDYTDGRIKSMYIEWDPDLKFDSPENVIAPNAAQKIWKSDSDMKLNYRIFNTYDENGEINGAEARLIYLNNASQTDINAFDGEYYAQDYSWSEKNEAEGGLKFDAAVSESATAGGVKFNESELKRMEELAGYVKIEDADKNVRAYKQLAIDDSYKLSSYSTGYYYSPYTSTKNRPVVWNLQYTSPVKEGDFYTTNASATVDAISGKVLSFSTYIDYAWFDDEGNFCPPELKITEDEAKKIATEFLEEIQPEKTKNLVLNSANHYNSFNYKAENYGKKETDKDGMYYTSIRMSYDRTYNDIPVMGNTASVIVDCISGKITEYSVRWTESVDFVDSEAKISADEAVDAYFENGNTSLRYVLHTVYLYDEKAQEGEKAVQSVKPVYSSNAIETRNETRLVYTFNCPFYAISAVSGKAMDYSGNEYVAEAEAVFNGFSDIEGHWAEEKIGLLADIGVVLPDEQFNPDSPITQKEFIAMLMACVNRRPEVYRFELLDGAVSSLVSNMTSRGFYIPERDADIDPDAPLMRKDAAKFIMRSLGYEAIATIPGIFTTDFIDNAEIDTAYIGYAALAKGLGIISGSHGRFNGNENLTKAECVILVYNYLNADK